MLFHEEFHSLWHQNQLLTFFLRVKPLYDQPNTDTLYLISNALVISRLDYGYLFLFGALKHELGRALSLGKYVPYRSKIIPQRLNNSTGCL